MLDNKFWKKYFEVYDVLNKLIPYDSLLEEICEMAEIKQGDIVLDAGSGTGNLSLKIGKRGGKVYGVDYPKEGIKIHKNKDPEAKITEHDLTQPLIFPDKFFDKLVSNNVLYTISREKRQNIFKEFHRVLKPGGIIVISNLAEHFKPIIIYKKHISEYYKRNGWFNTFIHLSYLIIPTIKIFYYNILIHKENKNGSYDFFKFEEQSEFLSLAGFTKIYPTKLTYAKQALLNKAIK